MSRKKSPQWLRNSALMSAMLLPLHTLADDKLVVIVEEPPLEIQSVASNEKPDRPHLPAVAVDNHADLHNHDEPPAADRAPVRPTIDTLAQRNKAIEFITLNSVLFTHNGTALDNRAKQILNDIAAYLQDNEAAERLLINGFADKTASEDYNAKLSAKRAFVVREYLRYIGVPTHLMRTISWGEGYPADEHWTHNGRKRNRRVELYLIQKQNRL